jgi:sugar O-acyltransferase (sialic acid O-acetyltransferase NeuD family)
MKVVVFGAGKIAEEVLAYFTLDSPHEVVAFTVDGEFAAANEYLGLPVVPFEEVERRYPPGEFAMFVAMAYQDLNRLRARKCDEAREKGYELVSYVSSLAANVGRVEIGWNCLVLEHSVIQPTTRVGNDVYLWSVRVGHHTTIGDHCFISHTNVAGNTVVEPYCFVGVGANIGHGITVGEASFIGAGALITKNAEPGSVHILPDTPKYRLDSSAFLRLTKMG